MSICKACAREMPEYPEVFIKEDFIPGKCCYFKSTIPLTIQKYIQAAKTASFRYIGAGFTEGIAQIASADGIITCMLDASLLRGALHYEDVHSNSKNTVRRSVSGKGDKR